MCDRFPFAPIVIPLARRLGVAVLHLVHIRIGALQQLSHRITLLMATDSCGKRQFNAMLLIMHDASADALERTLELLGAAIGENNEEFIAAHADRQIGTADSGLHMTGEGFQGSIACRVTELAIDPL